MLALSTLSSGAYTMWNIDDPTYTYTMYGGAFIGIELELGTMPSSTSCAAKTLPM